MTTIVHTLRYGPQPPWMTRCVDSLETWVRKYGYTLRVWSDPEVWKDYPSPKFCEIDMLRDFLASDYDRLLYVDADVFVNPHAPQFPEIAGIAMATDPWHGYNTERWKKWCDSTYELTVTGREYCNAGVWSCDKPAAKKILAAMKRHPMVESFMEQDWLNAVVYSSGATFNLLPSDWNRYARDYNPGWFLHLWGVRKQEDLQTLDDLGLLTAEPDGLTYCVHTDLWPAEDKIVVQEFVSNAGLGNQMFEFAAGCGIAKRLGLPFMWSWKPSPLRDFGLTAFGIGENYVKADTAMSRAGQGNIKLVRLAEQRIRDSRSRFIGVSCPFQAEECIDPEVAREWFKLEPFPLKTPKGCTPVGVQVRRGDYVGHGRLDVVTPEYFLNAMDYIREVVERPHFFVVSDDPAWCQVQYGHRKDVTVLPPQGPIDGLRTLASCEAHVISNSTFGWWGAWLGEKGPVVVPEIWHHGPGSYGDWKPAPERWHRIPTKSPTSIIRAEVPPEPEESQHARAIVIPWKADGEKWQELRFTLRSIHQFFEDKDCPIYILGTQRPSWLLFDSKRVKFVRSWTYRDALIRGLAIADEVLWMNDDTTLLKPTTWDDCRRTLYLREVGSDFIAKAGEQTNPWRAGCLKVLAQLSAEGITSQKVFSTHTPYVYRREEALAVLQRFGIWDKMPFELAYYHLHAVEPTLVTDERAVGPEFGNARFLNYGDDTITPSLRQAVRHLLPDFAPWELNAEFSG